MKNCIFVFAAFLASLALVSASQAGEYNQERMNIDLWGNGFTSVSGNFGVGLKTRNALQNGTSFAAAWQYYPLHSIGIQAAYELGWMKFESAYRPVAGKTPNFVVQQITLSGIYNFSNLIGSGTRLRPYVNAGVGIYPFRVTEDGRGGNVVTLANGNKFEKTSFGLSGGAGLEVMATNHVAVFGGARYNYLFAKDDNKFGADSNFSNQGLLSFGLGLSYHFPMGSQSSTQR